MYLDFVGFKCVVNPMNWCTVIFLTSIIYPVFLNDIIWETFLFLAWLNLVLNLLNFKKKTIKAVSVKSAKQILTISGSVTQTSQSFDLIEQNKSMK